jgi:hypothetical protein
MVDDPNLNPFGLTSPSVDAIAKHGSDGQDASPTLVPGLTKERCRFLQEKLIGVTIINRNLFDHTVRITQASPKITITLR